METNVNYALVGLFVIILTIALFIVVLWLSVGISRTDYNTYLAYMQESVTGLDVESPVKYNGVVVGYVQNIRLDRKNPQQVILTLEIDESIPVTETTRATLMQQGITGIAFVGLQGGYGGKRLHRQHGFPYPVIKTVPSFMMRLDTILQQLSSNIDSMALAIKQVFSPQNQIAFSNTLLHLERITDTFANKSKQIDQSLDSMDVLLNNAAIASRQLPPLFGSFTAQIAPETYHALMSIQNTSNRLESLVSELNDNPSIIFSGKPSIPKGPGE